MQKPLSSVRHYKIGLICNIILFLVGVIGCGPRLSTAEDVVRFEKADPLRSEAETATEVGKRPGSHVGPYRVIPGDILEFQMPAVLRVISSDLPEWLRPIYGHKFTEPYLARVNQDGTITLPIVGQVHVSNQTLAQIEVTVVDAYYPKYVVNQPMVVCEVKKYQGESERVFTVLGLVNEPDAFTYPPDVQYNLMEALAFAGGLDMVADPRCLTIFRQDTSGEILSATFKVDNRSLADAYSVAIKPGDVIYVGHTLRTRINKFLSSVFHVTVGAETRYTDF